MGFEEPFGQAWPQIAELLLAFALSSVVGLERQLRGKSAGLRTQAIVGTASALILLVSKYGFTDVLGERVVLDPSRVAAQIVTGIGFLGAGIIITRQGAIRGLTTAAAVWETAAIGMAAGAGLPILAVVVTALHFVIVLGYTQFTSRLPLARRGTLRLRITYTDRPGILRQLLATCAHRGWVVFSVSVEEGQGRGGVDELLHDDHAGSGLAEISLTLNGPDVGAAPGVLATSTGITAVSRDEEESE